MKVYGMAIVVIGFMLWVVGWRIISIEPKSYWFVSFDFSVPENGTHGSGWKVLKVKGKGFLISEAEKYVAKSLEKKYKNPVKVGLINRIRINKKEYESATIKNEIQERKHDD